MSMIITIAGCKGGVGKSVIASAIAVEAGKSGRDVLIFDADFGGPNLHTCLGIQSPKHVIGDFLSRKTLQIEQIILDTRYEGVRFISSAGNVPSQANLRFAQKAKIIDNLIALDPDILLVDVGAGSSNDVMDFFSMSDGGVIVSTPDPASIISSYGFLKNVLYRKFAREFGRDNCAMQIIERGMNPTARDGISGMEELMGELAAADRDCYGRAKSMLSAFRPRIIINRATSSDERELGEKLRAIVEEHLSIEVRCLGAVADDPVVRVSVKKMMPFNVFHPQCEASRCIEAIAEKLLETAPAAMSVA